MTRRDRETGTGGGVFILTSDKYICSEPSELNKSKDIEMVWIQLQITGSKIFIICLLSLSTPKRHRHGIPGWSK